MTEHRTPEQADDTPLCEEPADARGWFRCSRPAGHGGERHHVVLPGGGERHHVVLPGGGTYTWGYVAAAVLTGEDRADG